MPRLRAITMTACVMARSSLSSASAPTKERSTFSVLTLNRFRYDSDECPVPKSSRAMRTPMRAKSASSDRVASQSSISIDSVSSMSRRPGAIAYSRSVSSTSLPRCACRTCRADRLMAMRSGGRPSASQAASCAQAVRMTQAPTGTTRPVSSSTPMNRSGGTRPFPGERQRSSASTPVTTPSDKRAFGW
jgi:hypothetical protein